MSKNSIVFLAKKSQKKQPLIFREIALINQILVVFFVNKNGTSKGASMQIPRYLKMSDFIETHSI